MSGEVEVDVTVALVTRNRREELARALTSVMAQRGVRMEVIVFDDASHDGTAEMVARDFPSVELHRSERAHGAAGSRNEATRYARSDIVVYLDDDAWLPSSRTVRQVVDDFDDPRIAVVAIPFDDVEEAGTSLRQQASTPDDVWVIPTFTGAAYAVRSEPFRAVGGYRPEHINMYGEESDLSLRLLDAGYVTRAGRADRARHEPSLVRSPNKRGILGRRNELVWSWSSFPAPWHLVYVVGYLAKGVVYGVQVRRLRVMLHGMRLGLRALREDPARTPVSRAAFRVDRRLRRHKTLTLAAIEADLPPLRPPAADSVTRVGSSA